jgi:hypothetical protein
VRLFRASEHGRRGFRSCWTPDRSYAENYARAYNEGKVPPGFAATGRWQVWTTEIDEGAETVLDDRWRGLVAHVRVNMRADRYAADGYQWVVWHEEGNNRAETTPMYLVDGDPVDAECLGEPPAL